MNPENKLKTPAGYNGRTSAAAYDLGFEFATRGVIKGFQATAEAGRKVRLASTDGKRSIAVAYDGKEKAGVYMDVDDFVTVGLKKLPTDCWHTVVAIVKATPTGTAAQPDNPESVAIFDIEGQAARPMEDAEVADYVATSTALGAFQGGKWCTLCKAFVAGNAETVGEILPGAGAETALPITVSKTTSGRYVEITDAAFAKLAKYRIDGQTIQDGIPAPDAPVELTSDNIAEVNNLEENLIPWPYIDLKPGDTRTQNGITFTCNQDRSIHLKGTSNISYLLLASNIDLGEGVLDTSVAGEEQATNGQYAISSWLWYKTKEKKLFVGPGPVSSTVTLDTTIYPAAVRGTEIRKYKLSAPVELRSVGDVHDSIEKRDGVWGVMRRTIRWERGPGYRWHRLGDQYVYFVPKPSEIDYGKPSLCNLFPESPGAFKDQHFTITDVCYILDKTSQSIDEWNARISGKIFNFVSARLEPIFEPLPQTDQEIFENLHSFSPTTILATQGTQTIEYITAQMQPILDNLPTLPVEVTNIDPGEGAPLAPGKLIGVYKAS